MSEFVNCPVCNRDDCKTYAIDQDGIGFDCEACGKFTINGSTYASHFEGSRDFTLVQRAALSHYLRKAADEEVTQDIASEWLSKFLSDAQLPTPPEQAAALIRLIGDYVSKFANGLPFDISVDFSRVGSRDSGECGFLIRELLDSGQIKSAGGHHQTVRQDNGSRYVQMYNLTFSGWEKYETERRGLYAGNYGFIAMKFGEKTLDDLVSSTIKPGLKQSLGYDLIDLRDVARAGVIDNILREQIRDAAFVLVDLTHDNSGAYWEAGYAEGLGKPVVYLCEKEKFDKAKTHFDTNHCTTVIWSKDKSEQEGFVQNLSATLRRSLDLFERQTEA